MAYTDEQIAKLVEAGFRRWTKGGRDRLYINAESFGLELGRYKSGNICWATFNGKKVSHAEGGRIEATKAYIDLADGKLNIRTYANSKDEIRASVQAVIDKALA